MQAPSILTAYIITNHPAFITKSLIQIKNLFHESLNPGSRRHSNTTIDSCLCFDQSISNKISETKQFQAMFGATLRAIAVLYN